MTWLALVVSVASAQSVILGDVHPSVEVGENVTVSEDAVVEANAILEDGAFIGPGAFIGANTRISTDAVIGRQAVIREDVFIPSDALVGRLAFVGAGSVIQEDLILGYKSVVGSGVQSIVLTMGALSVLGGDSGSGDTTVQCPVLVMARGAHVASQAPFTLLCDDPESEGIVLGPNVHVEPGAVLGGGVRVRKNAHIGQRAFIESGVRIGRDACVGDSSVVSADSNLRTASRTSQDEVLAEGTFVGRAQDVGEDAAECGVWPQGEPGEQTGVSEDGYPVFAVSGESDPDPGSREALSFGEDVDASVCGGNEVMYYAVADNSSNQGALQDSSVRERDLVGGGEVILHAHTPGVGSLAVSPDGTRLFVGYGIASQAALPEVVARISRVGETVLATGVETLRADLDALAGSQRSASGIHVTDETTFVMASGGSYGAPNPTSAVIAIDRLTGVSTVHRVLEPFQSPRLYLTSPTTGEQYWLDIGILRRLNDDGSFTDFDIADEEDVYSLETAAFAPDGTLFLAEFGEDEDEEGEPIPLSRIRTFDIATGEFSLFTETVAGQPFYPYHLEIDCDGDLWLGFEEQGNGPRVIWEISADGTLETPRLDAPGVSFRLGAFTLAPE